MLSGFVAMTQEGETLGRLRRYVGQPTGNEYDCRNSDESNMQRLTVILHWLYVVVITANIIVITCIVQLFLFLGQWIMELILVMFNSSVFFLNYLRQGGLRHHNSMSQVLRAHITQPNLLVFPVGGKVKCS